ncbi:hypothetical protein Mal64_06610 [Pseudobythopirellula maris]|uniref:LTD domain-containing protein n=1 Tax=Pseudobythopirellula maris TaxID=2527991 RepID=A0A5C5ZSS3_9BACT|nr:lamin tail domain-containing protein [Pseudobythopirellula maris]TWT90276.1 hypothetical protein Mal64_06610 [Pseudobythopirellula maris]
MKKVSLLSYTSIFMLAIGTYANAGLFISEVVDATLPGGNPKFVEITNSANTDYTFTGGGIAIQSNANIDLVIDVDLTGVTITAGDSFVIQTTSNDGQNIFENTYGFPADLYSPGFFSNGDDRYILATADDGAGTPLATVIADIHGVLDTDGSGEPWEYTDGFAYRLPTVTDGNGGVFDISEWYHSGVNGLETGDDATELPLIQAQTTPGTHTFGVPEPSTALLALASIVCLSGTKRLRS